MGVFAWACTDAVPEITSATSKRANAFTDLLTAVSLEDDFFMEALPSKSNGASDIKIANC